MLKCPMTGPPAQCSRVISLESRVASMYEAAPIKNREAAATIDVASTLGGTGGREDQSNDTKTAMRMQLPALDSHKW